jgi:hypothetical protein
VAYEPEGGLSESRANAAAYYDSAEIESISTAEIDEEYEDLVAEFASSLEKMIDAEAKRLADKNC